MRPPTDMGQLALLAPDDGVLHVSNISNKHIGAASVLSKRRVVPRGANKGNVPAQRHRGTKTIKGRSITRGQLSLLPPDADILRVPNEDIRASGVRSGYRVIPRGTNQSGLPAQRKRGTEVVEVDRLLDQSRLHAREQRIDHDGIHRPGILCDNGQLRRAPSFHPGPENPTSRIPRLHSLITHHRFILTIHKSHPTAFARIRQQLRPHRAFDLQHDLQRSGSLRILVNGKALLDPFSPVLIPFGDHAGRVSDLHTRSVPGHGAGAGLHECAAPPHSGQFDLDAPRFLSLQRLEPAGKLDPVPPKPGPQVLLRVRGEILRSTRVRPGRVNLVHGQARGGQSFGERFIVAALPEFLFGGIAGQGSGQFRGRAKSRLRSRCLRYFNGFVPRLSSRRRDLGGTAKVSQKPFSDSEPKDGKQGAEAQDAGDITAGDSSPIEEIGLFVF